MIRLVRVLFRTLRFAFRWTRRFSILVVVAGMLALNIGTLVLTPLAAAAGSMLARAGITTVADARAAKLAQSETRLASQADELAVTKRRAASQADELAASKRRIASQADDLATANRRIAVQADELTAANRRLARQTHDLATANRHAARQADELATLRHVRYRGETKTARAAVADTVDRIARRTATATARNVAAIPAEALPVFGIAVIAGATAWELRDACALMQDVHELNVAFAPGLGNDPTRHEACGMEVPTRAEIWQRIATDPKGALDEQPAEYGDLPAFEKPGWWDWALSWFSDEAPLTQ